MVKRVQHIRHNNTQADLFTGLEGEFTYDVTNKEIRAHDGETAGGIPTARKDLNNVAAATTSVAGKMAATDKQKLDGIEAGAQVNPDAATIKSQYESNGDTNAFTDADLQDVRTDLPAAISQNSTDIATNAAANTATQNALDVEEALNATHRGSTSNPHSVTKAQVGLGSTADGAEINPSPITAAEITTGTETAERTAVPKEIKDAIDALLANVKTPKAVARLTDLSSSPPTLTVLFNVGLGTITPSKLGTGNYRITWTNALAATYGFVTLDDNGGARRAMIGGFTGTTLDLKSVTVGTANGSDGATGLNVIIYGDLA